MENTKQDLEQENRLQIKFLQLKFYWKKPGNIRNVEIYQIFVDFKKAYDSIRRDKLYAIMADFGIPNKLIRLTKATVENSAYYVKVGTIMTDGFKVGTGLQGDGLAPNLFNPLNAKLNPICHLLALLEAHHILHISRIRVNIALGNVVRQLLVQTTSTIFHNSVQLIGYAEDINIMGRTKRVISDVYGELKERAKEVGLIINVDKTKQWCRTGDLEREEH